MDSFVSDIKFDALRRCNYCSVLVSSERNLLSQEKKKEREFLIDSVKQDGIGKKYDCIVGVSGGLDSSYALMLAVDSGLRPLAVHLDNGWNSELAIKNIERLVERLKVDLYTHVIEWTEYKDLQRSFFTANVVDLELPFDNAILAINYKLAKQHQVKWILAGTNQATEGMRMPPNWSWLKYDSKNIKDIHKRHGSISLKTIPFISLASLFKYRWLHGIRWLSFLDYFDYQKDLALKLLSQRFDYEPYPYKHYESVFTRFYQAYILPKKFGIDKRKLHLSSLIVNNQLTREKALEILALTPYQSEEEKNADYLYVLKKLDFTPVDFEKYLAMPGVPHSSYRNHRKFWTTLVRLRKIMLASQHFRKKK